MKDQNIFPLSFYEQGYRLGILPLDIHHMNDAIYIGHSHIPISLVLLVKNGLFINLGP